MKDQWLWYNTNITKKDSKNLWFNKAMYNAGIQKIRDICNFHEGKFMELRELNYNYRITCHFIENFALLNSIPKEWKTKLQRDTVEENVEIDINLDVKKCYWKFIEISKETSKYDHGKIAWSTELKLNYDDNEWGKLRTHGHNIIKLTKLRLFQYKILSKKIVTNLHRSRWDKDISPMCTFCN